MNPEKQGSVYDLNFRKKWWGSFDEAEKFVTYKASYTTMKAISYTCMGLWLFCLIGMIFFDFGVLPLIMVPVYFHYLGGWNQVLPRTILGINKLGPLFTLGITSFMIVPGSLLSSVFSIANKESAEKQKATEIVLEADVKAEKIKEDAIESFKQSKKIKIAETEKRANDLYEKKITEGKANYDGIVALSSEKAKNLAEEIVKGLIG